MPITVEVEPPPDPLLKIAASGTGSQIAILSTCQAETT
jgi:hypothetical protein